jgi:hypothetical protein
VRSRGGLNNTNNTYLWNVRCVIKHIPNVN